MKVTTTYIISLSALICVDLRKNFGSNSASPFFVKEVATLQVPNGKTRPNTSKVKATQERGRHSIVNHILYHTSDADAATTNENY